MPVSRRRPAATIIQLSDFHLFCPPSPLLAAGFDKRLYGRLAWCRRRHELRPDILDAMIEDICRRAPDLVTVTGDLTHLGFRDEYLQAVKYLEKLGGPERVMVIPGNHDAYVAGAWENNWDLLASYLAGAGEISPSGPPPVYPLVRSLGEIAVLALNSARPRPWWLATGRLGPEQLAGLDEKLASLGRRARARVILVHHPPVPGLAGWRRRLSDERAFLRVLAERGAELVLFGHLHYHYRTRLAAGPGPVPCFGVPAATALGRSPKRRSRYNIYQFFREPGACWRLAFSVRRWSESHCRFQEEESGEYELSTGGPAPAGTGKNRN